MLHRSITAHTTITPRIIESTNKVHYSIVGASSRGARACQYGNIDDPKDFNFIFIPNNAVIMFLERLDDGNALVLYEDKKSPFLVFLVLDWNMSDNDTFYQIKALIGDQVGYFNIFPKEIEEITV